MCLLHEWCINAALLTILSLSSQGEESELEQVEQELNRSPVSRSRDRELGNEDKKGKVGVQQS